MARGWRFRLVAVVLGLLTLALGVAASASWSALHDANARGVMD